MNFATPDYAAFLVVVFALFWFAALRAGRASRAVLLLAASYYFYACWNATYLLLIVGSTLLDYWVGGKLARVGCDARRARRALLGASLLGNIGVLAVFKYYGFFAKELRAAIGLELPELDVLLPVGISFYTFQSLSYTIDIYRGRLRPARNLRDFALFVAFFPQLVAGPIVRARDFLPQLERMPRLSSDDLHDGVHLILRGLAKKLLVANVLGAQLVDPAFAPGSQVAGAAMWLAIYGYALQIYGDFSGYSDIAIGSARLFGIRLPANFASPYLARSIQDFWRRWHISLSTWLRDYLYVPLGGNRRGPVRTYVNLALTMLLGGLWHGAAWNFVIWGGMHGVWLGVNRWWQRRGYGAIGGPLGGVVAVLVTFHLVCLAWVFFRAPDAAAAWQALGRAMSAGEGVALSPKVVLALSIGVATHAIPTARKDAIVAWFIGLPSFWIGVLSALAIGLFASVAEDTGRAFIYFQF